MIAKETNRGIVGTFPLIIASTMAASFESPTYADAIKPAVFCLSDYVPRKGFSNDKQARLKGEKKNKHGQPDS